MTLEDWQVCDDVQGEFYLHKPTGCTFKQPPQGLLDLYAAFKASQQVPGPTLGERGRDFDKRLAEAVQAVRAELAESEERIVQRLRMDPEILHEAGKLPVLSGQDLDQRLAESLCAVRVELAESEERIMQRLAVDREVLHERAELPVLARLQRLEAQLGELTDSHEAACNELGKHSDEQDATLEELNVELVAFRSRLTAHEGLDRSLNSVHAKLEDHTAFLEALRKRCSAGEDDVWRHQADLRAEVSQLAAQLNVLRSEMRTKKQMKELSDEVQSIQEDTTTQIDACVASNSDVKVRYPVREIGQRVQIDGSIAPTPWRGAFSETLRKKCLVGELTGNELWQRQAQLHSDVELEEAASVPCTRKELLQHHAQLHAEVLDFGSQLDKLHTQEMRKVDAQVTAMCTKHEEHVAWVAREIATVRESVTSVLNVSGLVLPTRSLESVPEEESICDGLSGVLS